MYKYYNTNHSRPLINDSNIHPGAEEICEDGIDSNCNADTDEVCLDRFEI
ncbi:MAG: MopE-related protein [Labilibaculum antarcticum]